MKEKKSGNTKSRMHRKKKWEQKNICTVDICVLLLAVDFK